MKFAKLFPDAISPSRKNTTDAGADVYAYEGGTVPACDSKVFPTGIAFEIPEGYMLEVRPKGRSDYLIGAGIVDAGYTNQIFVKVVNYRTTPLEIKAGDALAQVILVPIIVEQLQEVAYNTLIEQMTERGVTGGIVTQFVGQV
jgi:dUTP pyrophosphatase